LRSFDRSRSANAAKKNTEAGPATPDLHYLRYLIERAKQGIGPDDPPGSGTFPPAVEHTRRAWQVTNQLGTVVVETKKASSLLVPADAAEGGPATAPSFDEAHYVCYRAKASKTPSDQAPDNGKGVGVFRKDLQAFLTDALFAADCAVDKLGATAFDATVVQGACLVDFKKPVELCNPAAKSAVEPPRATNATIDGSTPAVAHSLLCYQAKTATRVTNADAAALASRAVGTVLAQRTHVPRKLKNGTEVSTAPGNQFPRPVAMDTIKLERVCLPTDVLGVAES
jgi:hypothetical protein